VSALLDGLDFIRDLLKADSDLVVGVGQYSGIGDRLYTDMAPTVENQQYPICLITLNAGADVNLDASGSVDYRYLVKVISGTFREADLLGYRVYVALHEAAARNGTDFCVYRCQRIQKIHFPEVDAGKRFYHDGGIFRLRMNAIS